jgi:alpha-ribazole phosphatase
MARRPRGIFCRYLFLRRGPLREEDATRAIGHADLPLAPGIETREAAVLGRIREHRPQVVLASDLCRARATAERFRQGLGVPLRIDPALRERSLGSYDGRPWPEIVASAPLEAAGFLDGFSESAPPGGETLAELADRALPVLWREGRRHARGVVLLVGHAGVIRAALAVLLRLRTSQVLRFQLDPFGLTIVEAQGPTATLVCTNVPPGAMLPA